MDTIIKRLRESRLKAPDQYKKNVRDILKYRLGAYETDVDVLNVIVKSQTTSTVTLDVEYDVKIRIPYEEDGHISYEHDIEYRRQTMVLDKGDLGESKVRESEGKYWMGKYQSAMSKEWKKVVFQSAGTIEDAEETLDGLLHEPYTSMRVLGSAPSLEQCKSDGFTLLESEKKSMEFPTEEEAREWAKDNGYKVDKIQNGQGSKACICWMTKMNESTEGDSWSHWKMPEHYGGPWEMDHYYKDYGSDILGIIYPPYEANIDALKEFTHYDHVAILYDNSAAREFDSKSFDSMEAAKAWVDEQAEYTLGKMSESEESSKFSVGSTFKNANFVWKVLDAKGDYTLVYAEKKKWNPYVVAWKLGDDGSWAQGHYFEDEDKARAYLNKKA